MIRLASVPARHPYVTAITDPHQVTVLPDPPPLRVEVDGQWWPPRWLEPDYLCARIAEIDALHVHFGFDAIASQTLLEVCAVLADHRVPLIVTVHDLHNPHFVDPTDHAEKLGVLIAAANAVITLTQGAARTIAARWHRVPVVLPHPHLLALSDIGAARNRRSRPVVAVHGKALRANLDPWSALDALVAVSLDAQLRFDLDDDALTSTRAPQDLPQRLARYAGRGVDVRTHPPFSDEDLGRYLRDIDVLVLPYRFGTHSGWVEICYDAGVTAVITDCGHFHEQRDVRMFALDGMELRTASLVAAVTTAVADVRADDGRADPGRRDFRRRQRRDIRAAHTEIYDHVTTRPRVCARWSPAAQ